MKRSAGLPHAITINKSFHQLRGENSLHSSFLFYYCAPFTTYFIFALDLMAVFLFCRNNTPFTSLHSLTSTEIGQSLSLTHPAKRRDKRASIRRFSPPHFLCCVLYPELGDGFHHVQIEQERGNTFMRKITGITVCSEPHQICIRN